MGLSTASATYGITEDATPGTVTLWEYEHDEDARAEITLPGARLMSFRLSIREARELIAALEDVLAKAGNP